MSAAVKRENAMLRDLSKTGKTIAAQNDKLDTLYEQRTQQFVQLRKRAVSWTRLADAAGCSPSAVVQAVNNYKRGKR